MNTEAHYINHKESTLSGRYITLESIAPLLINFSNLFSIQVQGHSEENREIHSITLGTGTFKILMWSQMHGNESTTTKSIFDLLNFLSVKGKLQELILKKCTIKVLPMLNPDGAVHYTRENANGIDLNRDAQNRSQRETQVLMDVFTDFQPNLCLNMHDQRSIFSVGKSDNSAVISFLAPAADESKSISDTRTFAMQLISFMAQKLQSLIPNHIGRYDDTFNLNCIGDTFQSLGVPTVLFEAGHSPGDYKREKTREYIYNVLIFLFEALSDTQMILPEANHYFSIPENEKLFFDIIIKNAQTSNYTQLIDIAIQFEEKLINQKIQFVPKVQKIGNLSGFFGHKNLEASAKQIFINQNNHIEVAQIVNSLRIGAEKISII